MSGFLLAAAGALLLVGLVGLPPVLLAGTVADRVVALQLTGTIGIAILLLLAGALGEPALRAAALILAALAAVTVGVFAARPRHARADRGETRC